VRDIDADLRRGWLWMATWGGVLCWKPEAGICVRHTSAEGLLGNAMRSLTVDDDGLVWAGAQEQGLCRLTPDDGSPWQPQLETYTVLRLAPRPDGGVYAALRDVTGAGALVEIAPPQYRPVFHRGGLATREIDVLLVDEEKDLWLGNVWGLHRLAGSATTFETRLSRPQVRALATIGQVLWLGTDQGLYVLPPGEAVPYRNGDWPYDDVIGLGIESETGDKWVATTHSIGRIIDNAWQPLRGDPHGDIQELLVTGRSLAVTSPASSPVTTGLRHKILWRQNQVWTATGEGVFRQGIDECDQAFALSAEDGLSNGVQCLWAEAGCVWMGTARDLYCWDGKTWRRYDDGASPLPDIRAIASNPGSDELVAASWPGGVHRFRSGVHLPHLTRSLPAVALAAGGGCLWAATTAEIACLSADQNEQQQLEPLAREAIGSAAIQTLCAVDDVLWVGTSSGLWRYRLGLWHPPADPAASIQALARHPVSGRVWAGAQTGLYRADDWHPCRKGDVRSLAFCPDGTLWIGLAGGLELWPADMPAAEPVERWSTANSGLAADTVTALAVRDTGGQREVWAGSPAGVSCYRYDI
jgi:ligand-binding sensor domain-containing protein